jgi:hypothetical protein
MVNVFGMVRLLSPVETSTADMSAVERYDSRWAGRSEKSFIDSLEGIETNGIDG